MACTFTILHEYPSGNLERAWRNSLPLLERPAHYSSPEFFLEPSWTGKRPFVVLALDEGSVVGVLPAMHEGDKVNSHRYVSVARNADPVAVGDALARGLLAEAHSARLVTIDSWVPLDSFKRYGFRLRSKQRIVLLDLTQGLETLFKQLNARKRNKIRASRRKVSIVRPASEQDIHAFYAVYSAWYHTKRKRIHGDKLSVETFLQRFHLSNNFQMFLACFSGKVIAGITLRSSPGGLVEYANNSSLDEFLYLRPNDLLVWNAIEWASGKGFVRFSLGGSHRFLREFGGELIPIYRYRLDQTWLHHYDVRQALVDGAREALSRMPPFVETAVRALLGKTPG
jgi:predicted N-acyltransferase